MDNKATVARATALMAANAYALIQTMRALENSQPTPLEVFWIMVPLFGLACAFGSLEEPVERWERWGAVVPLGIMIFLWMVQQWNS